jgi:phosphate-selective porin OprO/OprP
MKHTKLVLAMAATLTATASFSALAMDLYVDSKTKQIYTEPAIGRQKLGSFEQVNPHHKGVDDFSDKINHELADQKAHIENDIALQNNSIKALEEKAEVSRLTPRVSMDSKGLQVESADKKYKFKLGGRIHAEAAYHDGDTGYGTTTAGKFTPADANDGTDVRRARMRMEGVFGQDWLFRTEADFAAEKVAMKDVYIQYLGSKWATITVGQQKQNFSRELQESSNDMMFTERSLMNMLNDPLVDRAIGLNAEHFGSNYVAKFGLFGNSITPPTATGSDEGWAGSSRLTWAPIMEKTKLVHLGVAGNYRQVDDNGEIAKAKSFALTNKTTNFSGFDPINTKVTNVNDIGMLGLEGGAIYGPFSMGAEYTRSWVDRKNGDKDLTFDGWYVDAGYTITGESRTYKNGNFTYLKPNKPFGKGGLGAWELAGRYSQANLDKNVQTTSFKGSDIGNMTIALNWYVNENVRFMADYMRYIDSSNSFYKTSSGNNINDLNVYTLRGQVAF